jgi:hypothetical protein
MFHEFGFCVRVNPKTCYDSTDVQLQSGSWDIDRSLVNFRCLGKFVKFSKPILSDLLL